MKWRSAGNSTPVEVDPGDRPAGVVQTATEDPTESLLSRIAVLESREQVLKTELASLQTDLVELRQHLDDPSADNGPSVPDEMDVSQANDPETSRFPNCRLDSFPRRPLSARSIGGSLVSTETLIPPPPDGPPAL